MDNSRVLERLGRIDALDRSGASPDLLLTELRRLLREAEQLARERATATDGEEVVGRLRAARARDIIGM
jgi:hypothetical protein